MKEAVEKKWAKTIGLLIGHIEKEAGNPGKSNTNKPNKKSHRSISGPMALG
ncbi:hypothetical protein [Pectinatus frisingensis]|uniref:hypothetical protein n=1 Tax=Pectinatus frisingensis TaxID=865 RepID=UPI0018C609C8|nr:hypothetical protein [Pectinatus frisingensis]